MRRILYVVTLLALSGAICVGPFSTGTATDSTGNGSRDAKLVKFTSASEMLDYIAEQVPVRPPVSWSLSNLFGGGFGCPSPPSILTSASDTASEGGTDTFSSTNLQEAGVDESDVVKNDGTFIYLLRGTSLRIIQAVPADALKEVGRIDLTGGANTFYLSGNKIITLLSFPDIRYYPVPIMDKTALPLSSRSYGGTTVTLIDVTDRSKPTIQQTWQFQPSLAASRLIGDKLHLVLTTTPSFPRGSSSAAIRAGSIDELLPAYEATGTAPIQTAKIADWSDFYHPTENQGYGLTTVTTIDLANLSAPLRSTGITADAGVIYASPTALYVTDSQDDYWYYQHTSDTTMVHKFNLTGDHATYTGSALVPGHLLNQYSLGEKDGYLRLGSTTGDVGRLGSSTAVNAVYVLGENATQGQLDMVGKIEGIAPGEKIYSARFVGDRGFLVTFEKVDPLYTLDMSDPAHPQVVGQLKVPGYSDYIHPMDANHLLTIGKDAIEEDTFAWYQGVQLSIFDVTDFANPQLLAKEVIGVRGTESEANTNPKAFNYFAPQNALAIPISLYEGPTQQPNQSGYLTFAGLYIYHAAVDDGFSLLGRIAAQSNPPLYTYGETGARYTRGIFIGDSIYAVSPNAVIAAPTVDPSQVQSSVTLK